MHHDDASSYYGKKANRTLFTGGLGRPPVAACVCIIMVLDLDIFHLDAGLCLDYNALEFLRPFRERPSPCILDFTYPARDLSL